MSLDDATLRIVSVLFSMLVGGLLLFSWNSNRVNRELLVFGSSFCIASFGLGLSSFGTVGGAVDYFVVGMMLLFFGYGWAWQAMCLFERRQMRPGLALAGGFVWLVAVAFVDAGLWDVMLIAGFVPSIYAGLMACELWRGRAEKLPSRMALLSMLAVDSVLLAARNLLTMPPLHAETGIAAAMLSWVSLLITLATMAAGYFMLSLIKERLETEQRAQTLIDPLTGLGNRRALRMHAERILRRQSTIGEPVCVAILDLDHFKQVNDTFGHFIGDNVLRVFAERAMMKLRPSDYLFRIGGEEFLCILQTAQERDAVGVIERIRRSMQDFRVGEGKQMRPVTLSAGVASSQRVGYDLEDLTRAADSALYRAKREGRNCVRVFTGDESRQDVAAGLSPPTKPDPQPT